MTKGVSFMGTEAMKPNCAMRAHDYHGVKHKKEEKWPTNKMEQKEIKKRKHTNSH